MRVEYISATGEKHGAYVGKSNPEFTRLSAFRVGTSNPITLRWDSTSMDWREVRELSYRTTSAIRRMYPELRICAEQDAWRMLDAAADKEGVILVERGQVWRPVDTFSSVEELEVWGLT